MYQSRIIIHLLTPQGLLKRLLNLCIEDIKRVLRRLLFSTVFVAWQARCACLCGCPSALVNMPATSDPAISSFNSTGILPNYFIGCWQKEKKKTSIYFVFGFSMDVLPCFRQTWLAFCCRRCWPGAERALSIPSMLLVVQRGLRDQQRWCGSQSFMPQHLTVTTCSQMMAEVPFVMLLITKNISLIACYPQTVEIRCGLETSIYSVCNWDGTGNLTCSS